MRKPSPFNNNHFLNRIPLQRMTNGYPIDPYDRLQETLSLGDLKDLEKLFNAFCNAAMRTDYKWKTGSPGNCLFIAEEMEAVVESCYMIHIASKKKEVILVERETVCCKSLHLPTRLTEQEWCNPLIVLKKFFAYQSLAKWKAALHHWTEAALSNQSVTGCVNPKEVLPFCRHLQKLIEAAHWIAIRCKDKEHEETQDHSKDV